jgi:hypothetical protein
MAFADFSLTNLYTDIITKLNAQLTSVGKLFKNQTTGDYIDQIRYNSSTKRLEYWTGTAWAALDISLATIAAATASGSCTGNAATATNATTHIATAAPHSGHAATIHDHAVTTSTSNTKIGLNALAALTLGGSNTAIGNGAMLSTTTGAANIAIGQSALRENIAGVYNVAIGVDALRNYGGNNNTAVGNFSMQSATTGANNVSIGYQSAINVTTGAFNVAVGKSAGSGITTGQANIVIGADAGSAIVVGIGNIAIGEDSLGGGTGDTNVAVGHQSLLYNTSGSNNTALGYFALASNSAFHSCVGLGWDSQVTGNLQVQLGSSTANIYSHNALNVRSDARDKTDITDTVLGSDFVLALRPVDYRWDMREDYIEHIVTTDKDGKKTVKIVSQPVDGSKKRNRKHHGLVAQEVKAVMDAQGVDFSGYQDHSVNGGKDVLTLQYEALIAPMIKTIQELAARINVLEGERP